MDDTELARALSADGREATDADLPDSPGASAAATLAARRLVDPSTSREGVSVLARALARLALDGKDDRASLGTRTLFRDVVEPLSDGFSADSARRYRQLFAEVLDIARSSPSGGGLDRALAGLPTAEAIERRAERVARPEPWSAPRLSRVKRAIVLSRVTLGADVAVTSVVLERLRSAAPAAERVLIAGPKAAELMLADGTRLHALDYPRHGGLAARLDLGLRLRAAVAAEIDGLAPDEAIVLDPDSRLTQLGLLPCGVEEQDYRLFDSRGLGGEREVSIGALTVEWLDVVLGPGGSPPHPRVHLAADDREAATDLRSALGSGRTLVAVGLGHGGNPDKRVRDPFEPELLRRLAEAGATLLVDRGIGDEVVRCEGHLRALEEAGHTVLRLDADDGPATPVPTGPAVLAWQGAIGRFAAWISTADAYVGYDSSGQHIAVALGVPTIDVFAGFTSRRMLSRWSPYGPAPSRVVPVDTRAGEPAEPDRLAAEVAASALELASRG